MGRIFHRVQGSTQCFALPFPARFLADNAQNIQRGRRGRPQFRRRRLHKGDLQQTAHRGQCCAGCGIVPGMGGAGPAQPQKFPRRRQRLIKANAFPQDLVFKTVRQLRPLADHRVPVGVGQKSLVPGCFGELPLRQADHKHCIGFGQTHTARRGQNDTVQALGNMSHIGGAQQQREQLCIIRRGQNLVTQQLSQLIEQPHDDVPFPQDFVGFRKAALAAQRFRQRV